MRHLILQTLVLAIEPLVVVHDLIEEIVDFILVVAAETPLEFLVVNIHWCKHDVTLSHW